MRALALALYLTVMPASAQECNDWPTMIRLLGSYGESPIFRLTESDGDHLRFFGNPETGTWTIIRMTQGCWIIAGHGYGLEPIWSGEPT